MGIEKQTAKLLTTLGVSLDALRGNDIQVHTPIDGSKIASLRFDTEAEVDDKIALAAKAFETWRDVPAPKRGELIRQYGQQLRNHKEDLAQLVSIECGKVIEEARGEVQEMIDICDFAVGLSRQLYGLTIASERPDHVMQENWLPLGPIGVITAFNFPVAVWAWNFALAIVCGDTVVWKPSEKTPLTALACQTLFTITAQEHGDIPYGLSIVVVGDHVIGDQVVNDTRLRLISATGSCKMGRIVGPKVAQRFGRSLLELGGNNAVTVTANADLALATQSIIFGAVGTTGQRCTTTRRVIAHKDIFEDLFNRLRYGFEEVDDRTKVGNPLEEGILIGPLIDKEAFDSMQEALRTAIEQQHGEVFFGERVLEEEYPDAYYVRPALVRMHEETEIVKQETFAPILYVFPYHDLDEAIRLQNDVPQGLSSAIFTTDLREAEYFKKYSDTGICNVNIGTSGAEIGGAFGGEKETGGGREAGSDSWKAYMRRQTSTTYYGAENPELAQGVKFETG